MIARDPGGRSSGRITNDITSDSFKTTQQSIILHTSTELCRIATPVSCVFSLWIYRSPQRRQNGRKLASKKVFRTSLLSMMLIHAGTLPIECLIVVYLHSTKLISSLNISRVPPIHYNRMVIPVPDPKGTLEI